MVCQLSGLPGVQKEAAWRSRTGGHRVQRARQSSNQRELCEPVLHDMDGSGRGVWGVKVWANNPAACMRDLVPALAQLEVVTRPFTAVVLPPSQPSVAADGRLPAASIAGYAVAGAFVLAALLGIGVYCFRAPSSQHITYKRLEGGSTLADADAVHIRRRMLL